MRGVLTLVFVASILALSVVRIPTQDQPIVLEAESYADLKAPMVLSRNDPKASGNAYVSLPLGAGQGWRGKGGGEISYRIETRNAGDYHIWARTLWKDGCTNAVFLSANGGSKVVLGNDAIFGQWHWTKAVPLQLEKGVNVLKLSNHSDGIAIDKLVVTDNPLYLPDGLGEGITQFSDGFAGCDVDNTGSWNFDAGIWRVVPGVGDSESGANDCLAQWDPGGGVARGGYRVWKDYEGSAKMMLTAPGTAGFAFFDMGTESRYQMNLEIAEDRAKIQLIRVVDGKRWVIAEASDASCSLDRWYELGYRFELGNGVALLDGEPLFKFDLLGEREGGIALVTEKTGGVYFDSVEVKFERTKSH